MGTEPLCKSVFLISGKTDVMLKQLPFNPKRKAAYPMIITTGNDVAGYEIVEYLKVVRGIVVRATGIGRGFVGGLRSIAGGNIPEYVDVCEEARQQAYDLLVRHASECRADAVIAMRYDATEFMPGTTEVLAYGTAVKLKKKE